MKRILAFLMMIAMIVTMAACGESAEKSSDGEIAIALITNTTGDYAQYGVPVHNGAMLYIEQINAAGGINGKQIKVYEYDDKGDGIEAVNAFNLASEKNISGVIGSVLTGPTLVLADATYEANMPQVTASATSPSVTIVDVEAAVPEVRTNVFRSCFLDPFQGEKMVAYAVEELGAKTAAVFYQTGSDYSEGVLEGINDAAAEKGLSIIDTEAFSEGDKDYNAQMTNIAAKDPDVVLMPIYYGEAGLATTALRAAGCDAVIIGSDGFGGVSGYASAEDLEGTVYCSGYAPGTESVAQFEKDYEAKYGEAVPNMFAPLAYDAAMLICKGIEAAEAKGLTPGSAEYKQAIIDAISSLNAVEGITGSYTFDEFNNPDKSVAILEVVNGQEVFKKFF